MRYGSCADVELVYGLLCVYMHKCEGVSNLKRTFYSHTYLPVMHIHGDNGLALGVPA